ncbi:unnamed protein product, partial [Polarella glacialis]
EAPPTSQRGGRRGGVGAEAPRPPESSFAREGEARRSHGGPAPAAAARRALRPGADGDPEE